MMELRTNYHVLILLEKMVMEEENTATLFKLHDRFFFPLRSLVLFGEKLSLLLHMLLIVFPLHTILECLLMKNCMENFLIILHCGYLGVHALFYDLMENETSFL